MRKANLIDCLKPYWQWYTNARTQEKMKPLAVSVKIEGVMAGYDNLNLDSLLARLVVDEATGGNLLGDENAPYLLPVPLRIMWRHPESGIPLWAGNAFVPKTHNKNITIWWHKRFIKTEMVNQSTKKSAISERQGRYKEKRTPLPAQTATEWQAECIGDMDEIGRLLEKCARIGKKRYAIVQEWVISPIAEFVFNRPVPVQYVYGNDSTSFPLDMAIKSWSSPYWVGVPETRGFCTLDHLSSN